MFWFFGCEACGILAPWPGIEPVPPALEGEVLTTGPLRKSPKSLLYTIGPGIEIQREQMVQYWLAATAAATSLQSCLTLCDPIDGSPLDSSVPGILQARILEWVAISFSNAWKWKGKVKLLSCVRLLATPWTAAYQAPPSMGSSRQEYWSGVPLTRLKFKWLYHWDPVGLLNNLTEQANGFRYLKKNFVLSSPLSFLRQQVAQNPWPRRTLGLSKATASNW